MLSRLAQLNAKHLLRSLPSSSSRLAHRAILTPALNNNQTSKMSSNTWSSIFSDPFFFDPFEQRSGGFFLPMVPTIAAGGERDSNALTRRGDTKTDRSMQTFRGPKLDFSESEKAYTIKADCPGLEKSDIKISVEDNLLTLEGERKHEHEEKTDRLHVVERSFGHFRRSIRLPPDADIEKCTATMDKGVLQLELPKNPAKEERKQIEIK
ncbi:hypothetical protein HDU86_003691 [Geranomyces michiganensis]|nr:hypothetical protein HDU86_003691 [Geranomyces michiganensis]